MTNLLKNRDITLTTNINIAKAMFFPLVMNRCESWSIKKAQNTINKVRRQLTKCKKIFTAFIQTKDNLPNT